MYDDSIVEVVCIRSYFSPLCNIYWMRYDVKTLHNAETSMWRFFRHLLQHHVKVLPLYVLSELG